jgi:hypothetical protein
MPREAGYPRLFFTFPYYPTTAHLRPWPEAAHHCHQLTERTLHVGVTGDPALASTVKKRKKVVDTPLRGA